MQDHRRRQHILCLIERELAQEIAGLGYDIDAFVEQAIKEKIASIKRLYRDFNLENNDSYQRKIFS